MKLLMFLVSLAAIVGCTAERTSPPSRADKSHSSNTETHRRDGIHPHAGHGMAEAVLMLQTKPKVVTAGVPVTLQMMIHSADGEMVRDFETIHEKKVHLIIV